MAISKKTAPKTKAASKPTKNPDVFVDAKKPLVNLDDAKPADDRKPDKREAILFAGARGASKGGIDDLRFRGTVDECREFFNDHIEDFRNGAPHGTDTWGQIVDAKTLEVIDTTVLSVNSWQAHPWAVL